MLLVQSQADDFDEFLGLEITARNSVATLQWPFWVNIEYCFVCLLYNRSPVCRKKKIGGNRNSPSNSSRIFFCPPAKKQWIWLSKGIPPRCPNCSGFGISRKNCPEWFALLICLFFLVAQLNLPGTTRCRRRCLQSWPSVDCCFLVCKGCPERFGEKERLGIPASCSLGAVWTVRHVLDTPYHPFSTPWKSQVCFVFGWGGVGVVQI